MATRTSQCPQCGALTSIPATGLQMTCEYCGLARPVPDADKRRAKMKREAEREEEHRRKADEKARREAERQDRSRRQRRRSAMGSLVTLPLKLLPLALIGFLFYYLGGYELCFGDDGRRALAREVSRLEADGYSSVAPPASERVISGPSTLTVGMERGHCYAVAVGAGRPVRALRLRRSTAVPNLPWGSVVHCPRQSGVSRVEVVLDGAGRFSWALLRRVAPTAPAVRPRAKVPSRPRRARRRRPGKTPRQPGRDREERAGPPPTTLPDPFESEIPIEP